MSAFTNKTNGGPATSPDLEERFRNLVARWEEAVAHHSSSRIRFGHPAYQEIIGLGADVVPLLLKDLESTNRHWFEALKQLTGANPVPAEVAGNIPQMKEAWLHWARETGHRW